MQPHSGSPASPVWLIGDSNPDPWAQRLKYPLDDRHPTRHNIWTPVWDRIQDHVYREGRLRLHDRKLFIRNAVADANVKPRPSALEWTNQDLLSPVEWLRSDLHRFQPPLVLAFGQFAFEFVRRALYMQPPFPCQHWGLGNLRRAFDAAIAAFDQNEINVVPLLHATIARGKFLDAHAAFGGHYFGHTGERLAHLLLAHFRDAPIWVGGPSPDQDSEMKDDA
ncbi:hypothetical protein [Azospirillum soli]|uniref:hypothetical protein n=1 Tax=Azospirillum soli TaxID=1304799 RepID=UPI001AE52227|nr:hypothetical protein [Azospirillum soli]MBP2315478.1 hypothetical protein [Azospirillum soli]